MDFLRYVGFARVCNVIKEFPELNHNFVKESITFTLLYSSISNKWRNIYLDKLQTCVEKLIQERTMTSQLIKDISVETVFLLEEIK